VWWAGKQGGKEEEFCLPRAGVLHYCTRDLSKRFDFLTGRATAFLTCGDFEDREQIAELDTDLNGFEEQERANGF
jgi:hypothetical protein